MIAILVWNGDLHTATAHNWIWSTQMRHTAFTVIGEFSRSDEEGWPRQDKTDGRP